uniref:Uncharacterized protein n=1 Tax=Setaria italica TaxID=4555 RepID=K3ZYR7_SETIT
MKNIHIGGVVAGAVGGDHGRDGEDGAEALRHPQHQAGSRSRPPHHLLHLRSRSGPCCWIDYSEGRATAGS